MSELFLELAKVSRLLIPGRHASSVEEEEKFEENSKYILRRYEEIWKRIYLKTFQTSLHLLLGDEQAPAGWRLGDHLSIFSELPFIVGRATIFVAE